MALKRSSEEEKGCYKEKKIFLEDEKKLNNFTQWLKTEGFHLNSKVLLPCFLKLNIYKKIFIFNIILKFKIYFLSRLI